MRTPDPTSPSHQSSRGKYFARYVCERNILVLSRKSDKESGRNIPPCSLALLPLSHQWLLLSALYWTGREPGSAHNWWCWSQISDWPDKNFLISEIKLDQSAQGRHQEPHHITVSLVQAITYEEMKDKSEQLFRLLKVQALIMTKVLWWNISIETWHASWKVWVGSWVAEERMCDYLTSGSTPRYQIGLH